MNKMMSMRVGLLTATALGCLVMCGQAEASLVMGSNLVVNGGAEAPANPSGGSVTIPSWTSTAGAMTVVPYGLRGGFPTATDPGPSSRGNQFFAGGEGTSFSEITQSVSVADGATAIDSGSVSFSLSAYLGGYIDQNDFAAFSVTFESAANTSLGSSTLTGPNSAGRNDQTGLLPQSMEGSIPIGTRNLLFALDATRLQGDYNDGYADNLSFIASTTTQPPPIQSVPEPFSVTLLGVGVVGLMATRFRAGREQALA